MLGPRVSAPHSSAVEHASWVAHASSAFGSSQMSGSAHAPPPDVDAPDTLAVETLLLEAVAAEDVFAELVETPDWLEPPVLVVLDDSLLPVQPDAAAMRTIAMRCVIRMCPSCFVPVSMRPE